MKRVLLIGFIFGCLAPLLLFGVALAFPAPFSTVAQKFIEFTYLGVHFFNKPFGMLNALERVSVIISGGVLWASIFYLLCYFRKKFFVV